MFYLEEFNKNEETFQASLMNTDKTSPNKTRGSHNSFGSVSATNSSNDRCLDFQTKDVLSSSRSDFPGAQNRLGDRLSSLHSGRVCAKQ